MAEVSTVRPWAYLQIVTCCICPFMTMTYTWQPDPTGGTGSIWARVGVQSSIPAIASNDNTRTNRSHKVFIFPPVKIPLPWTPIHPLEYHPYLYNRQV